MTLNELILYFNREYGTPGTIYPRTYEVDVETYANVCCALFQLALTNSTWHNVIHIAVGINGNPLVKGIEIIMVKNDATTPRQS